MPRKRVGRPTKPPKGDERVSLGLRVTATTKRRLDEAATRSGRSQSQEAELRLERSFELETQVGGREMVAVVNLMSGAFLAGGQRAARKAGHREWTNSGDWIEDPACYEAAMVSVAAALFEMRPDGEAMQAMAERVSAILDAAGLKLGQGNPEEKDDG